MNSSISDNNQITPKKDLIFKRLFGSKGNEKILKDFLEYITQEKIKSVDTDLATEFIPELQEGKSSRVDVRAQLDDGTQIDIEMQTDKDGFSSQRCLFYWSKIYSNGIKKSRDYKKLKKVICIWIVDDTVYKDIPEFKTKWTMQERQGNNNYFKEIEIYVIELKKFRKTAIMEPKKKDFWLWFIDYTNREMVDMACLSNKRIKEAREQLDKIASEPGLMEAILNQEMAEMDQKMIQERKMKRARAEAREAGLSEGRAEGRAEGLAEGQKLLKDKELEIAKRMLDSGMDKKEVAQITGITIEEIEDMIKK